MRKGKGSQKSFVQWNAFFNGLFLLSIDPEFLDHKYLLLL